MTIAPQLVDFSGLRELVTRQLAAVGRGVDSLGMSMQVLAAVTLVQVVVGSLINTVPAFGEEVGWRGFLFPRLQELFGPVVAVVGTGVVWGLWHAPLILLGYNYPSNPVLGLLAMCGMTTLFGHDVRDLHQESDGSWTVKVINRRTGQKRKLSAKFVFVGAGGGALEAVGQAPPPRPAGLLWMRATCHIE